MTASVVVVRLSWVVLSGDLFRRRVRSKVVTTELLVLAMLLMLVGTVGTLKVLLVASISELCVFNAI